MLAGCHPRAVAVRRGGRPRPQALVTAPAREWRGPSARPQARPCRVASPAVEQRPPTPGSGSDDSGDDECPVFIDRNGEMVQVMCCDYGMRSGVQRVYGEGGARIPLPLWRLAGQNFAQEWLALRRSFRQDEYARIARRNPAQGPLGKVLYGAGDVIVRAFSAVDQRLEDSGILSRLLPEAIPKEVFDERTGGLSRECRELRAKLRGLKLSNKAVWDREHAREAAGGGVDTPWFVKGVYLALCVFLDLAYENRPIQRFWFLETVARMPYFSYISCLHLYETLGWWRAGAQLRIVHAAEEINELHHLQIMESLGGDRLWVDRFMGQHAAVVYYFILVAIFFVSPPLAYNFSELIEAHAVDTYMEFAEANKELLKTIPPPLVAVTYYMGPDLSLFDAFQTSQADTPARRPQINNLYDVFLNIAADEGEHVTTMQACQDYTVAQDLDNIRQKHAEAAIAAAAVAADRARTGNDGKAR